MSMPFSYIKSQQQNQQWEQGGQALGQLIAALMGNLLNNNAQNKAQDQLNGMMTPQELPPAVIPQAGGQSPAIMPRIQGAPGSTQLAPDRSAILKNLLSTDPTVSKGAANFVGGLQATNPQNQFMPFNGGLAQIQTNPLNGQANVSQALAPQSKPMDPLQQQLILSQIEKNRRVPTPPQKNATTIDLPRPVENKGGVRYKWVQDVDPVTRKPVGEPRQVPWQSVPAITQQMDAQDYKPELSGQALFNALSPGDKALVKGMIDGNALIEKSVSMRGGGREKYVKLALRVDPSYDQQWVGATNALTKDALVGPIARASRSMNMLIGHMATLRNAADALKNSAWQTGNTVANYIKNNLGDPTVTTFLTAAKAVKSEGAATFKAGQGNASPTEQEIKDWGNVVDLSQSPDQYDAFNKTMLSLLGSRMASLQFAAQSAHVPPTWSLINPKAQQILDDMGFQAQPSPTPAPGGGGANTGGSFWK